MRVTALLPTFNVAAYIEEAVRGLLAQPGEFEIVAWDDCSTDGTYDILTARLATIDPRRVKTGRNEQNLGVIATLNRMLPFITGDIVVWFDSDDVSRSDRVEKLSRGFEEMPDTMALGSDFEYMDGTGQTLARHEFRGEDYDWKGLVTGSPMAAPGCSLAYRRPVLSEFGPLEGARSTQDFILVFRAALLGWVRFLPDALVRYRLRRNSISRPAMVESDLDQLLAVIASQNAAFRDLPRNFERDLQRAGDVGLVSPSERRLLDRSVLKRWRRMVKRNRWQAERGRIGLIAGGLDAFLAGERVGLRSMLAGISPKAYGLFARARPLMIGNA